MSAAFAAPEKDGRLPRLLVINPNMTASVTDNLVAMAREEAAGRAEISGATATFGASYISSRISYQVAGYAALELSAAALLSNEPPDVIVMGCFGDPGIGAVRELTGLPVIGFAESGILDAAAEAGRFLLVTNGDIWVDMLQELVQQLGVADHVAAIAALGTAGHAPDTAAAFIDALGEKTGASRCVFGGAGLMPLIAAVTGRTKLPLVDPHRRAIHRAIALAGTPRKERKPVIGPTGPIVYSGLTPALTTLIGPKPESLAAVS